jgi:hypothetical protein
MVVVAQIEVNTGWFETYFYYGGVCAGLCHPQVASEFAFQLPDSELAMPLKRKNEKAGQSFSNPFEITELY